jgi:hypothetical protein
MCRRFSLGHQFALAGAAVVVLLLAAGPGRCNDKLPQPPMVDPGRQPGAPPSDAIVLFDGKNLDQWTGGKPQGIEDGTFNIAKTGEVSTKRSFGDCQLHIEWQVPAKPDGGPMDWGNSGVFFLSNYELQIIESRQHQIYADGIAGAIYGQSPPLVNASLKPGEWESYDVVFTAPRFQGDKLLRPAYFTVFWNGVLVQNHQPSAPTPHAIKAVYTPHSMTAPITLQYHNSAVRFRNIWVRPLKAAE